ncbi:hypothetical protein D3C78_1770890 [compost metagenome]
MAIAGAESFQLLETIGVLNAAAVKDQIRKRGPFARPDLGIRIVEKRIYLIFAVIDVLGGEYENLQSELSSGGDHFSVNGLFLKQTGFIEV